MDQLFQMISTLTKEFGKKKALAESIGTTPQSLNKWLSGQYKPNGETTLQLLRWVIMEKLQRDNDLEDVLGLLMQKPHANESKHGKASIQLRMQRRERPLVAAGDNKNNGLRANASVSVKIGTASQERKAALDARRRKIVEMRKQGFLFREIGAAVGVTLAYAQILYAQGLKRMSRVSGDVFGVLSKRAQNCLRREGFQTKDQVETAIKSGFLNPKRQSNYGQKTHAEICKWAGIC